MKDIIAIVFFTSLASADDWVGIHCFAVANEKFLRKYLELPNGIPSHDTIQRVFAMVSPEYLQAFRKRWNEVVTGKTGEKMKRILGIDGKTQRGNGTAKHLSVPALRTLTAFLPVNRTIHLITRAKKNATAYFKPMHPEKPKRGRPRKKGDLDPLLSVDNPDDRKNIIAALKATEGFAFFSCIAIGILQMVSLTFHDVTNPRFIRWLRTYSNNVSSEASISVFLRNSLFSLFHNLHGFYIFDIIRENQMKNDDDFAQDVS